MYEKFTSKDAFEKALSGLWEKHLKTHNVVAKLISLIKKASASNHRADMLLMMAKITGPSNIRYAHQIILSCTLNYECTSNYVLM